MSNIGFIVHPMYKTEMVGSVEKAFVYLFGRLESGKSFMTRNEFKPYFFIKKSDLKKALEATVFNYEETNFKSFDEEEVVKVILNVQSEVKKLRDKIKSLGINTFEADIRLEYRFLIDNFLQGGVEIIGNSEEGKEADLIFKEPQLKPANYFPKNLKVLSMDIETSMNGKYLYSISMVCDDYKNVLIVSKKDLKRAESFSNEKDMLIKFLEIVDELNPDIITGWNLIDFDLKFLEKKIKEHSLKFSIGRFKDDAKLRAAESFFQDSKAEVSGRMILDGIQILKANFVDLDDFKLDTAAQHFLGESKLIDHDDKGNKIEDAFKNDPQLLADYNLKDSELVLQILEKSTALNLSIQRSLLTGMPLDRVRASIASLDSVYLKELRKRGYVAPTAGFEEDSGEGKGGYVMSSKPGIYDYILVCDFRSLYPSIMRTFNIDPLSFVPDGNGKNLVKLPSGASFKNQAGIMPEIIANLLEQRAKAAKEKDELARFAIKILMNSFYGVLANPTCRFYSREMSNGITLTGQHIIKMVIKKVEGMGYDVIYGDTDSIFVYPKVESDKEAFDVGEKIVGEMNKFLEHHIKEEYDRKNYLDLQFEKVYKRFIMPKARGSDTGTKKRYAGMRLDKEGNTKMEFTGMEFVRRDWTDLAKNVQMEVLDRIFKKQEVSEYLKNIVAEVKAGKRDDWLLYRKAIRKDVDEYTKTTPPHVKAARLLGKDLISNLIEYYITTEGPEPKQKMKHKIDYDHYIEKQVRPIADSVLDFFGTSFDDILKNSKQKTLFGF